MRITRETLLKVARDFTTKRLVPDRNINAVFLVGSVRPEEAALPAVLDIDLLVIYNGEPPRAREVVELSSDVHLDIHYENARHYAQPRELRGDPWRGWAMWDPLLLHQKGHFFEYTQSSVRAQFDEMENVLKRSRVFANQARDAWNTMSLDPQAASPFQILTAAADAANALAALAGPPLTERSLLVGFSARAQALGQPELTGQLLQAMTATPDPSLLQAALPVWESCFQAAAQSPQDVRLHPARLRYYKTAIEAQLQGDLPAAAFWPLLYTGALAAQTKALSPEAQTAWQTVLQQTGLDSMGAADRLHALDVFLDTIEELSDRLAAESGVHP